MTAGVEAVFMCRHPTADYVVWRVNNVSVGRTSNQTSIPVSQGTGTLTILALPEYNGTVVECVALFIDGSPPEISPPVRLIVEGKWLQLLIIT